MRVGTNLWPGYEPLYLAQHLQYFDEQDIRLVEHSSASQVIRGFRNGLLDAAALTLDEVLLLKHRGFDVDVVLVMDISLGGDVIIATPDIQNMASLKARKVGVENSALGAYMLGRALEMAGLMASDVRMVPLEVAEHEQAFVGKQVDAVVTFEPVRTRLLSQGGKIIFDSSKIPGEIVDVLIIQHDYLEQNPQRVKQLLDDWFLALAYLNQQPIKASRMIAERMQLTDDEVLASYDGLKLPSREENRQLLGTMGDAPQLLEPSRKLAKVMLEKKIITSVVETQVLFSQAASFYEQ